MLMRLTTSRETESVAAAVEGTTAIDAATASTAAGRRSVRCVDNTGMPLAFSAYGVSWRARAKEMRSALDGQGPSPLLLGSPVPRVRRGFGDVGAAEYPIRRLTYSPTRRFGFDLPTAIPSSRRMFETRTRPGAGMTARREAITPREGHPRAVNPNSHRRRHRGGSAHRSGRDRPGEPGRLARRRRQAEHP